MCWDELIFTESLFVWVLAINKLILVWKLNIEVKFKADEEQLGTWSISRTQYAKCTNTCIVMAQEFKFNYSVVIPSNTIMFRRLQCLEFIGAAAARAAGVIRTIVCISIATEGILS